MNVRNEQRKKRKQEILAAALDLFIRRGYAATKISDIAQSVGMSVGLLFHYFESKEKLYESLVRYGISGPMSTMGFTGDEPLRFFEETAEKIIHSIHEQPFIAKMFVLMNRAFYNDAAPQSVKDLLRGYAYCPVDKKGAGKWYDPVGQSRCACHYLLVRHSRRCGANGHSPESALSGKRLDRGYDQKSVYRE